MAACEGRRCSRSRLNHSVAATVVRSTAPLGGSQEACWAGKAPAGSMGSTSHAAHVLQARAIAENSDLQQHSQRPPSPPAATRFCPCARAATLQLSATELGFGARLPLTERATVELHATWQQRRQAAAAAGTC